MRRTMPGTGPTGLQSPVTLMSAGRALYGLALLAAPGPVLTAGAGQPPSRRDCAVARVLGIRHVTQAILTAAAGGRAVAPGAVVDSLHAASMVALAAAQPRMRRAELADAAVAGLLAGLGGLLATH